ncbi:TetR/AcrR family transcriptional regulator [Xenorhabdus bovienii]|uniref:TetR/AcrR family transcriptional regulator n=1 Tax=Xenorhabdus bovienii TaxID=40576 RepID=UPI001EDD15B9|nr:TetR/AcrR family transcriptional regulator [Xenorhabdus bovienii]MCG3464204.1 TetR/AcrR family transcriptional regulator [Xenorhabdus bovienii]
MRIKEFDTDKIVEAAMQVFWLRGYAGTSIQDLVEGTGLSRSSLYNTFENKYGLYQKALEHYSTITSANVELISGEGTAKELIRKLLSSIAEDELSDSLMRGCMVANASLELAGHDTTIAELVLYNLKRLQKALEKRIQAGQLAGEISKEKNASALAYFFVNTIQGIRIMGKGCPVQERQRCLHDVINIALETL